MNFPFKPAEQREFDAVGFGTNAVDFLIEVPEYPAFDSKVELNDYTQAAGGEVASTMVGLQRLGLKTAYAGRFGDDAAGEFGLRSLREEGVDTEFAECVTGARTQIAFIVIDARNGERTVIWKRDSLLSYTAEEAPLAIAERSVLLHFTPHDAQACLALARHARKHGTIVSIDIDNIFDGVDDVLPNVDVLIASSDLPSKMFGIDDRKEALRALHARFGSRLIGVTLGERGSLVLFDGEFIETPGYAVPGGCRDTTGAGDAFRAGLIYGILSGLPVADSLRAANAVAALKCRAVGARTSLPTPAELQTLLKNI